MTDQILLTPDELADKLRVQTSWVYRQTRKNGPGSIPRVHVGKYLRFRLEDVLAWLQSSEEGAVASYEEAVGNELI